MKTGTKILVVDDEHNIVEVLKALLSKEGHSVGTASNGIEALEVLRNGDFDLMISDIRMASMDGLALLKEARKIDSDLAVIMITAYASVETAMTAMKNGAFDYICKPFRIDSLRDTISRALESRRCGGAGNAETAAPGRRVHFDMLVGESRPMLRVYEMIEKVASTDGAVLIRGQRGSGKSAAAAAIHHSGRRRDRALVTVDCAPSTERDAAVELFGVVDKGSEMNRQGVLQALKGGTVILDNIDRASEAVQDRLIRLLEEHESVPVGSSEGVPVDVRVIATAHDPLKELVKSGDFRTDLAIRLSAIAIDMPELRARPGDIPALADFLLEKATERSGKHLALDDTVVKALTQWPWPANVTELAGVIADLARRCQSGKATVSDLPAHLRAKAAPLTTERARGSHASAERGASLKAFLLAKERTNIQFVLDKCDGDRDKAAKTLGITVATLNRKLAGGP